MDKLRSAFLEQKSSLKITACPSKVETDTVKVFKTYPLFLQSIDFLQYVFYNGLMNNFLFGPTPKGGNHLG